MANMTQLNKERERSLEFLSSYWKKFFQKINDIDNIDVDDWKHVHLLGYIDKRYRQHYRKNLAYTYNKPPSKCTEMVLVKQMCVMLSTIDMSLAKEYVDWVFDTKIIPQNMKIRTLAFFRTPQIVNEFLLNRKYENTINRNQPLPNKYKIIIEQFNLPITTFGDLAFAKMSSNNTKYQKLFEELNNAGFNNNMLKKIL